MRPLKGPLLFLVIITMSIGIGQAKPYLGPQLNVDLETYPASDIDSPAPALRNVEIQYSKLKVDFEFPKFAHRKTGTVLAHSLSGEYIPIDYKNKPGASVDQLGGFDYRFMWVQFWSPKWKTNSFFKPGVYSDLEGLTGNNFRLQGGVILNRIVSKKSEVGIGVVFTNDFGEPETLVAFVYRNGTRLEDSHKPGEHIIDIRIPKQASYWHVFSERLQLGLNANITGGHYRINES